MKKVAVAGPVTANGVGDALQYLVIAKIVDDLIGNVDTTIVCSDVCDLSAYSRLFHTPPRLLNGSFNGTFFFREIINAPVANRLFSLKDRTSSGYVPLKSSVIGGAKSAISQKVKSFYYSLFFSKFILRPIIKRSFSFEGGILGGHTVCGDIDTYLIQYRTLRSAVSKGPIVTAPITISLDSQKDTRILGKLRKTFEELDFIFVRGKYSLQFIQEELGIRNKVAIALDSGFGQSLVFRDLSTPVLTKNTPLRIVIVPRKEYFTNSNKMNLYRLYVESLVSLINWMSRSYDVEIYLALQVMDNNAAMKNSGIEDILQLIKVRMSDNQLALKSIHVYSPDNIYAALKFYNSADLVITSYMHSGIIALSSGIPAIFIMPISEIKVLDNITTVGLDLDSFFIDMYNPDFLVPEYLIGKANKILERLEFHKKQIKEALHRVFPTIVSPIKKLDTLLE